MPELMPAEFTGERVIPGLVDGDLMNEHLARYRFAARFAQGARVLDAGCGSGYGSAFLAETAAGVSGIDISADAVGYAREHFTGVRFLRASCEALPFADAAFDLVTAFEVIEHLERWPQLLRESARVLNGRGVLVVSTPNKAYYSESRAEAGPNPFHCHEFELAEFEEALRQVFPHVRLWTQNHVGAIAFAPVNPSGTVLDAAGDPSPETAHFFVAACSHSPVGASGIYAWIPRTANLLREREKHITRLQGELAKKDGWLNALVADHAALQRSHDQTLAELKQRNEWAKELNQEVAERREAITKLQKEAEVSLEWARSLEARIEQGDTEIERLSQASAELEADLSARTEWAWRLEEQLAERTLHVQVQTDRIAEYEAHVAALSETLRKLGEERRMIAESRWIRLGRKLGVGPVLAATGEE